MAKIRIDPSEVQSAQAVVAAQARAMSEIYAQIGSVDGALDMTFSARADVSSKLTGMRRTGMTGADKLSGIATAMGQAVDSFVQTDQNVAREASGVAYLQSKILEQATTIVGPGVINGPDVRLADFPWLKNALTLVMSDQSEKARLLGGLFGAGSLLTGAITLPPLITQCPNPEQERGWLARFFNNELKDSGSWLGTGPKTKTGTFLGFNTSGTAEGDLLYWETGIKNKSSFKFKDGGTFGLDTEASATGALAAGRVEGNIGLLHGDASGKVGAVTASGKVKATLWDDGKFDPSLSVGGKLSGSVLQGEVNGGFGNDQYDVHVGASGDLLHAEAEGEIGAGHFKDKDGNDQYGVYGKVGGMASLAQGKVKGGFKIFGIKVDASVKGHVGAVGATTGAGLTTKGANVKLGGGLGVGGEVELSVDWSDAKWAGDMVQDVGDFVVDTGKAIGKAADAVGDFVGGAIDNTADFFRKWF